MASTQNALPGRLVRTAVVFLVAALATCSVLWPVAIAGRVPAFGDNISFWAPNTFFWTAEIKSGRFPSWNPYVLAGTPFAADINHGIFYPPNWILLVSSPAGGLRLLVIAHLALGIAGVYLFARSLDVGAPAALWAGVAFGFSEMFLPLCNHVVMLESMSWIGFALFLSVCLLRQPSAASGAMLALVLALCALAGDVHATYMIVIACAVVMLVGFIARITRHEYRTALDGAVIGAAAFAGSAALAAVALLPALQLASLSARSQGGAEYAAYHSLDPVAAIGMIAPNVFGAPAEGTLWNFRAGNAVFIGVVVLALAAFALRRPFRSLLEIALVVVGAVLSLGNNSPLWGALYDFMPGLRLFRQPREYFIIAALGIIILAAKGLDDISRGSPVRGRGPAKWLLAAAALLCAGGVIVALTPPVASRLASMLPPHYGAAASIGPWVAFSFARVLFAAGLAAAALALSGFAFLSRRAAAGLIAAVVVVDYAIASWGSVVFGPPSLCEPQLALANRIREDSGGSYVRIASDADGFGEYFDSFGVRRLGGRLASETKRLDLLLELKNCLVDNECLYASMPAATGYSTFVTARYAALWSAAGGAADSPVRLKSPTPAACALVGANVLLKASPDWRDCAVQPLAVPSQVRMCYQWNPARSFDTALGLVAAAPDRVASVPVIENPPFIGSKLHSSNVRHSVDDVVRSAKSVIMSVFTDEPGFLYLVECNYPGWKAFDNGAETPIYNANLAFRAVYLSAGSHQLEFRFKPSIFYWGAAISLAALAGLLSLLLPRPAKGENA